MGAQLDAGADRGGPVGDVGACLGALRAARGAMGEIDALGTSLIILRGDRAVGRPPMPAELVEPARQCRARLAKRQRRHHRFVRRIGRIACQAGHAHHPVVLVVKRLQGCIVDRPIVSDAIERAHAKIRRMEAREVTGVKNRAAADAVEVGDLDRRMGVVDRVVLGPGANIGIGGILDHSARLPVTAGAGVGCGVHPTPLFEAEDVHLCVGETPGHRRARRAGANNQHIHGIVHAGPSLVGCNIPSIAS